MGHQGRRGNRPAPHKDFSDLCAKMSGKGESASGAHRHLTGKQALADHVRENAEVAGVGEQLQLERHGRFRSPDDTDP